jgi:hypothetical protein
MIMMTSSENAQGRPRAHILSGSGHDRGGLEGLGGSLLLGSSRSGSGLSHSGLLDGGLDGSGLGLGEGGDSGGLLDLLLSLLSLALALRIALVSLFLEGVQVGQNKP